MIKSLILKLYIGLLAKTQTAYLQKALGYKLTRHNDEELEARVNSVKVFLFETLPELDSNWVGRTFCEGGRWNYFPLSDGSLPKFDFVFPSIPLYICIFGIASASWDEANARGISRLDWERCQADMSIIENKVTKLATTNKAVEPKLLVIRWSDSVNPWSLRERLQKLGV